MLYLFLFLLLAISPAEAMDMSLLRFEVFREAAGSAVQNDVVKLTASAQALPPSRSLPISSTRPLILDFARDFVFWADAAAKTAAYDWLAVHIMASEDAAGSRREYLSRNRDFKTWKYGLDLTRIQSEGDPGDDKVLHGVDGSRLTSTIWSSARWIYNLHDPAVQEWNVARLVALCGDNDGLFLDEHTAKWSEVLGKKTVIREYNLSGDALDAAYNADVVASLKKLQAALKARGKFLFINTADVSGTSGFRDQVLAANGFATETKWRPDAWGWPTEFGDYVTLIGLVSEAGGFVDLHGSWGYIAPIRSGGNYATPYERDRMWRLAAYHAVSGPGVYLSTDLSTAQPSFPSQWLKAYEFDGLGVPRGGAKPTDYGNVGSSDFHAVVYDRAFTNGHVYVRPRDGWSAAAFDDTTAVTITLPQPMKLLKGDGTLTDAVRTLKLRNAEAVIMVKP